MLVARDRGKSYKDQCKRTFEGLREKDIRSIYIGMLGGSMSLSFSGSSWSMASLCSPSTSKACTRAASSARQLVS